MKHLWSGSDYVVGNLETPVAGKRLKYAYEALRFNAPDDFLAAIKRAGVNFLSTANNHALDRGVDGIDNTIRKLEEFQFDHDGSFVSEQDSEKIVIKDFFGVRIAFVSCTYGTNQGLKCNYLPDDELWRVAILKRPEQVVTSWRFLLRRAISNLIPQRLKQSFRGVRQELTPVRDSVSPAEIAKAEHEWFRSAMSAKIKRAKSEADLVVVLPHVGGQYCPEPGEYQLFTMKWMSEAGADLIVANHAHIPQKAIRYPNGVIGFCALGDFTFYPLCSQDKQLSSRSIVLNAYVDPSAKRIVKFDYGISRSCLNGDGVSVCKPDGMFSSVIKELMQEACDELK